MAITITIQAETATELAFDVLSLAKILAAELAEVSTPAPVAAQSTAPEPAVSPEPAQAPAAAPAEPDHGITRETLIPHLAALTQAGKRDQVQAIFAKYGADKLSAVDPTHYPAILAEAQALATEGGTS